MSGAREAILQRLRSQLSRGMGTTLSPRPDDRGPLPARQASLQEHFIHKMTSNAASVEQVSSQQALVQSIQQFLQQHQLPLSLCAVEHPDLANLPWPDELQVRYGQPQEHDLSIISVAEAALAETGSVVMCSSRQTPTEANFLPDNFICLVRQSDIIAHMEDLWQQLRLQNDTLPAVVNIISGPSRTADVEQTIQLGAHGPRHMHVIIHQ